MSRRPRGEAAPRLFAEKELRLRPTGAARLRALARRPAGPSSARELRLEQDRKTMTRLRRYGLDLAKRFALRYTSIDPERDGVNGHYGICYEDGLIRIRLRHARTGRLLKESSLVDTLCHELAHLRHLDHSVRFQHLYQRILATARRLGYYQPGPTKAGGASQLSLFADGACGVAGRSKE